MTKNHDFKDKKKTYIQHTIIQNWTALTMAKLEVILLAMQNITEEIMKNRRQSLNKLVHKH